VALRHHKRLRVSNLLQQPFLLFPRIAVLQDHEPWKTRWAGNDGDNELILWVSLRESASNLNLLKHEVYCVILCRELIGVGVYCENHMIKYCRLNYLITSVPGAVLNR
jgi:hypothetical protein